MLRLFVLCLTLLNSPILFAAPMVNQLRDHASPYLAMHGHDPVQWQQWNAETVARAKRENKLLFVSSGYFSCHWCHVMQRESYQNQAIAALLNTYFIPVKVDREIHAALDAKLIEFVEATQGYAGWPLNVFITPEGYPLVGLVYLPPASFKQGLEKLSAQWQQQPAALAKMAKDAAAELDQLEMAAVVSVPYGLGGDLQQRLLKEVYVIADEIEGGFGQQQKFPSVPQLQVLLDIYQEKKQPRLKTLLVLTLDKMASQGLCDQLGGGFFRYAVDPAWQVPHFEKMLYDNALLARLYLQAAEVLNNKAYEAVGRETLDFMQRELSTTRGGLAASLSAIDDKGIEGGYYLWTPTELEKILDKEELAVARTAWQLDGPPDLDHGHHLVQAMSIKELAKAVNKDDKAATVLLNSARRKMQQARLQRKLPRDDKRIAAWNGLALSAFAAGARLSGGKGYRQTGQELFKAISSILWDGKELHRAFSHKGSMGEGGLEDYAYVAAGLYDWFELSGNKAALELTRRILHKAWDKFYTPQGWRQAERMLLRYGAGDVLIADGPMPSPSAVLIKTSLAVSQKTGDQKLRELSALALSSGHVMLAEAPFWNATQINTIVQFQAGK